MATTFTGTVADLRTVGSDVVVALYGVGAHSVDGTDRWSYKIRGAPTLGATKTVTIAAGGSPTFTATVTRLVALDNGRVRVFVDRTLDNANVPMGYFCASADAPALGDTVGFTIA